MALLSKIIILFLSISVFIFGWHLQTIVSYEKNIDSSINGELKDWGNWGVSLTVIALVALLLVMGYLIKTKQIKYIDKDLITILYGAIIIDIVYMIIFSIIVNIKNSNQTLEEKKDRLFSLTTYLLGLGGIFTGFYLGYFYNNGGKKWNFY